jgi:hypothetical protein
LIGFGRFFKLYPYYFGGKMCKFVSFICDAYVQSWNFSSAEGAGKDQKHETVAKVLKWATRFGTIGIFSGGALYAASQLGGSAATIQALSHLTIGSFGCSAAVLLIPTIAAVALGAIAGLGVGLAVFVMANSSPNPQPAASMLSAFLGVGVVGGALYGLAGAARKVIELTKENYAN